MDKSQRSALVADTFIINPEDHKALIFDMDGTIIDNMMVHHRAWQQLFLELGYTWTPEEIKERVWGKNEEIFERIFPGRFSPEEIAQLAERKERRYVEIYRPQIAMLAGLEQLLMDARAKGMRLGIATAAPPLCVDFVREALVLDNYFDTIVDAQQVARGKPHPEAFLMAASRLGVEPSECLVFEDAPVGVEAAEAARMSAFVVLTTHAEPEFSRFSNVLGFVHDFSRLSLAS
jgi:beta-phosphoglucomutase family hydrolase